MKRLFLGALVGSLFLAALAMSGNQKTTPGDLIVDVEARNPWTNLRLNNDPSAFHFVVMSDRTGGHRPRIFSQAVEQINLLQPAFVLSVGDLIEGYTKDNAKIADEWKEFQGFVHKLQMPFFYVPGNHDVTNPMQAKEWKERFGRAYYHFLYKDVLFCLVNSDDPHEDKETGRISQEQLDYFQKVLKENPGVRWTIVALHKPVWMMANLEKTGFLDLEKLLEGRKYTVFAGHVHRYQKFVRHGMNYYMLSTTGGSSRMRGLQYGEFDHIAWVTMKKDGPTIANLMLDGIYSEDLKRPITDEDGHIQLNRKAVVATRGKVLLDGAPVPGAQIVFHLLDADPKKNPQRLGDAFVQADGTFVLTTYKAFDGVPVGDYAVTVVLRQPFYTAEGKLSPNTLPEKYATPKVTELRAKVKAGETNDMTFQLSK